MTTAFQHDIDPQVAIPTETLTVAAFHLHSLKAVQVDLAHLLRTLYHLAQLQEQCTAYETPLPFAKPDLDRHIHELLDWAGAVVRSQDTLQEDRR